MCIAELKQAQHLSLNIIICRKWAIVWLDTTQLGSMKLLEIVSPLHGEKSWMLSSESWRQTDTSMTRRTVTDQVTHDLAAADGRLMKLFMGGSGLILRPAQPPFLCHRPLDGLMPSQRFRPAFPITRLLWSALETLPTVTIHVSNTCGENQLQNITLCSISASKHCKYLIASSLSNHTQYEGFNNCDRGAQKQS